MLAKAQGTCSFSIKTTVTPVDCRANGVISIAIEGTDLTNLQNFMYRAYPSGENPNDYNFITNNVISGLTEGTYVVEAKALCKLNDVTISEEQINVVVPRTVPYIEPDFTINPSAGRKSMSCLPTGMIQMQGIVKGKGPYTIKFTKFPSTYTGNTVLVNNATTLDPILQIQDLPGGEYEIELSDGCGSAIKQTATVANLPETDFFSGLVGSYTTSSSLLAKDNNCSFLTFTRTNATSASDWYYYANSTNVSKFYEYAIFYPGDDINNLTWNAFTSATTYSFNARYDLKAIRTDKDNKRPQVYVRIKGGNCPPQLFKPSLTDAAAYTPTTAIGCGIQKLSFGVGTTGTNRVICYPYTWEIVKKNISTNATETITSDSPRNYAHTDVLTMENGYTYTLTITDKEGYVMPGGTHQNTTPTTTTGKLNISRKSSLCNEDSVQVYISEIAGLQGGTIKWLDKSGASIKKPTHTTISVPKGFTGNIYPYSSDYTKSSYIHIKDFPATQTLYFQVADSCGISKEINIKGASTILYYDREPVLNVEYACGRATIKRGDLDDIYKSLNILDNKVARGGTVYMKIISSPSGATPMYSYSSGYIRSNQSGDQIEVAKSGIYTFRVSSSSSNFNTTVCYLDFDVNIQIPEMAIDEATSAAYRCPDSNPGTGYMNIKIKNGSGNYLFTLYSQNAPNTVLATSTNGEFTSWPKTSSDYYIIKVEDLTCGRSMTHSIFVYDLGNATLGWPENNIFIKCLGDKIKLYSLALGETSYTWTGPGGWTSNERNPEIAVTTLANSGEYEVTVEVPGCGPAATVSYKFNLSIADKVMYWNPDAVDNNWYNTANWLTSTSEQAMAVPAACTTVHIAGNATMYPNLDMGSTPRSQYGFPACDTIIFHYGSETIYPHFLKYNRAKIQYNFNYYDPYEEGKQPTASFDKATYPMAMWGEEMPVIKRAQWYTISTPLKHITGGDFGLGGYPNFYQKLYNSTDPQRGLASKDAYTLPFNTQNMELKTTGNAMALWVPDYDPRYLGLGDHKYLQALKGIIEMPYFLNPGIMAQRPLNQYVVADSTSLFQYYNQESPSLSPIDKWDSYKRGYQAYRFIFENDNDTVSIYNVKGVDVAGYQLRLPTMADNNTTRRVMIGNPLMCHIDFDKLYAVNSDIIEGFYMITNGASELFQSYRATGVDNELPKQIAPLQGFIVTLRESPAGNSLLFPLEGSNSVISPSSNKLALPKARSSQANNNSGWLSITATTPPRKGFTTDNITTRSTLLINHAVPNIPKVMFPEGFDHKAEIFLIGEDGYLNTEQVAHSYPEIVKFGLESTFKENITLQFKKGDNDVIDKVILVDKYLNETKDVSENGAYIFKHRSSYNSGLDGDRFELRITYKASSISEGNNAPIILHASRSKFVAESSGILNSVSLYNTLGESLISKTDLGTTTFSEAMSLEPGVYIASATLVGSNRVVTQKIIVR